MIKKTEHAKIGETTKYTIRRNSCEDIKLTTLNRFSDWFKKHVAMLHLRNERKLEAGGQRYKLSIIR